MRILFAADVFPDPNSGAAGTEYQTIQALRRLGHEIDEIWASDLPHRIKHGNLHYLLELPKGYRDVISKRWEKVKYDVVHVNQGHAYLAAEDHLRRRRPGIFVCRSHGLDDHMGRILKGWCKKMGIRTRSPLKLVPGLIIDALLDRHMRLASRYSSGFIVSSSLDRNYLIDVHHMQPERVACIPQAPPDFFLTLPIREFSPARLRRLLFIGGVSYWKGPHAVVAAVNELVCKHPDITFTWVCREDVHETALGMLNKAARDRTQMIGLGSQEDLLSIYDENGIFLYPSLFDGFAKVFIEAMSRGLCVIATPTGGMKDIIKDGDNGFLVKFNDVGRIVDRVCQLQTDFNASKGISSSARVTAEGYTWERVAKETVSFYERLLDI